MVRLKKGRTAQLGKVEPSLNEKLVDYAKLIGDNKIDLLEELILKELEGKVLTKGFIVPEKLYYFNMKELLEEGTVKASTNKPSTDFENFYTVKMIANNLDSKNKEFKTYCYNDNKDLHKGIFIYYFLNSTEAKYMALVFDYNSLEEELIISRINSKDLRLLIETEEDVKTVEEIIDTVKYNLERYNEIASSGKYLDFLDPTEDSTFFIEFGTATTKVIEDFTGRKKLDLLIDYGINDFYVNELPVDLDSISLESINTIEDIYKLAAKTEKKYKKLSSEVNKASKDIKALFDKVEELDNVTWEDVKKEHE